jgi:lipopolysaccharide transport system permease protein
MAIRVTAELPPGTRDGDLVGWQVFDPQTGRFLEEGEWKQAADGRVDVDLPGDPGRYHVYVSQISGDTGWAYVRGAPFTFVDVTVDGAEARIHAVKTTTLRTLRWRRLPSALRKALVLPLRTVTVNRNLIRSMVRRDILARYRGSFGDVFWTILNPLLLMTTYYFVFGVVLQARFGADPSRSGFVLYFLAGLLPWLAFSEAAGRAPSVVLEHRNYVKKLVFPVEILPANLVAAGIVTELFALAIFLLFLIGARGSVPWTALWLPLLLIPQLLFTVGLAWLLAAVGVFVRDLGQVIGFLLTLWFFLTPICYPEGSLPPSAASVLTKNPIYVLVRGYRAVFLEARAPDFAGVAAFTALAVGLFFVGHACFYKLRRSFADVI